MNKKEQTALEVAKKFKEEYPTPVTELIHEDEYQLAIAVMLSAQTTDKKVNQITPELFKKYPDWYALSRANVGDVQNIIHGVNFHLGKGERLISAGQIVTHNFNGQLPKDMAKLMQERVLRNIRQRPSQFDARRPAADDYEVQQLRPRMVLGFPLGQFEC